MDGMLHELVKKLQNLEKDLDSLKLDVREIQQELLKSTKSRDDCMDLGEHPSRKLLQKTGLQNNNQYAFHVQRSTESATAPPQFTLEFDLILTNFGGLWDNVSHMFIAPVKGLYVFHLTVLRQSSAGSLQAYIASDNKKISVAYVNENLISGSGSTSAVLELEALHRVYVRIELGRILTFRSDNVGGVSFTGYLLQQLA